MLLLKGLECLLLLLLAGPARHVSAEFTCTGDGFLVDTSACRKEDLDAVFGAKVDVCNDHGWDNCAASAAAINGHDDYDGPNIRCTSCTSGACRTHCCDAGTDQCSFCDNVDGSCYAPLALKAGWNPTTALADGWERTYNKDARSELDGPPLDFAATTLVNRKGTAIERLSDSASTSKAEDIFIPQMLSPAVLLRGEEKMPVVTGALVQRGKGSILMRLPFGSALPPPVARTFPYDLGCTIPLAWFLFAAAAANLLSLALYFDMKMTTQARRRPHVTRMRVRKRERSVLGSTTDAYAIFLPLMVTAMLFAGHFPDAADGKAVVVLDDTVATVAHWAHGSGAAEAVSEKREWEETRSGNAPDLSSLPLPPPLKTAPAPSAPHPTTRADNVDNINAATAPPPKMMMMQAAEAEGSHHYPAYFDKVKEKQRDIVDPAAAALSEMNPAPRTFGSGNDNRRPKWLPAALDQKYSSGKWSLDRGALSAKVTADGWLPLASFPSRMIHRASSHPVGDMAGERQQHGAQRRRRQQNDFDSTTLKAACDAWCANEGAAREKYGDIAEWNVGNVESFYKLFYEQRKFNADLSKWDLGSATMTAEMF
eukprot:gene13624-6561_t